MNLLVSYAHIAKNKRWIPVLELWASKGLPLIIDSGAFTAMKSGVPIHHPSYIALAKVLQGMGPNAEFIQLDVIRDPAATRVNLVKEYTEGLKTIPVLTHNATLDDFAELVEKFNPRVCVAGAVQNTPQWTIDKVGRCWERVGGNTQIHALGFTDGWHPFKSKAYTYDSTSWIASLRWGEVYFYDEIKGASKVKYKTIVDHDFKLLSKLARNMLMSSGITVADFRGPEGGRTSRSLISFITSASWLKWARKVEQNRQRFYFAAVEPFMLTQLLLGAIHNTRSGLNWPALKPDIRLLHDALVTANVKVVEPFIDRAIVAWNEFKK